MKNKIVILVSMLYTICTHAMQQQNVVISYCEHGDGVLEIIIEDEQLRNALVDQIKITVRVNERDLMEHDVIEKKYRLENLQPQDVIAFYFTWQKDGLSFVSDEFTYVYAAERAIHHNQKNNIHIVQMVEHANYDAFLQKLLYQVPSLWYSIERH